jgi:hypothetical protein
MNTLFSKPVFILRIVERGISDMQRIKEHLDVTPIFANPSVCISCILTGNAEGSKGARRTGDDLCRYTNERPAMGLTGLLELDEMSGIRKYCARQILWMDILHRCYELKRMKGEILLTK